MKKILTVLLVFGVIYILIHKEQPHDKTDKNEPKGSKLENFTANVISNLVTTEKGNEFIHRLIQPINKSNHKINNLDYINNFFEVIVSGKGEGTKAQCGYSVQANYSIYDLEQNLIDKQKDRISILGQGEIPLGITNILIGMQAGQEKIAKIPSGYLNLKSNKISKVKVKLNKVIDQYPIDGIKIFDDTLSYQHPIFCGFKTECNLVITKVNGETIYDQKINLIVGDKNEPYILSYSLFNKPLVGIRTVISPAKHLKGIINYEPQEEFLIMEFSECKLLEEKFTKTIIRE